MFGVKGKALTPATRERRAREGKGNVRNERQRGRERWGSFSPSLSFLLSLSLSFSFYFSLFLSLFLSLNLSLVLSLTLLVSYNTVIMTSHSRFTPTSHHYFRQDKHDLNPKIGHKKHAYTCIEFSGLMKKQLSK